MIHLYAGENALPVLVSILPYLAAMLARIIFRASGALQGFIDVSCYGEHRNTKRAHAVGSLTPFSGSAAIALLDDIFKTCRPDSY